MATSGITDGDQAKTGARSTVESSATSARNGKRPTKRTAGPKPDDVEMPLDIAVYFQTAVARAPKAGIKVGYYLHEGKLVLVIDGLTVANGVIVPLVATDSAT